MDLIHVNEIAPDELRIDLRPRPVGDPQHLKAYRVTVRLAVEASNTALQNWSVSVALVQPWLDVTQFAQLAVYGPEKL